MLIVEDDPDLKEMLREEIVEAGHEALTAADVAQARQLLSDHPPDLVISDLILPDQTGMDLLRFTQTSPMSPGVLLITAFGSIPQAVQALKAGADNFLTKPLDFDHLHICVERALELRRLRLEVQSFRHHRHHPPVAGLLGESRAMRQLLHKIHRVARLDAPVLITGESGTGKELVAQALHQLSDRPDGPFVPVNCAGIPENLLESELFGHVAGAFTGAQRARRGLFQVADGGVLFLDEIGELPSAMQAKLLRVLQNHAVRPVGSDQSQSVRVRILAASNRNLLQEVEAGRFRQDLYYRLDTFVLHVPPLREREQDLDLLIAHFLARYARELKKHVHGLTHEALQALRLHPFPGNVRELQSILQHAVAFSSSTNITRDDLPLDHRPTDTPGLHAPPDAAALLSGSSLPTLDELKRRYVRLVLQKVNGNKRRAAALLGIGRHTLYNNLSDPTRE
ncbi:MAG TPA: sigma-54 dependent transcriptional regulator [Methylomirabilota bacterium]|nr:sigma-54 dependent transcriptional regulator [Methylomirabilota bacterium]